MTDTPKVDFLFSRGPDTFTGPASVAAPVTGHLVTRTLTESVWYPEHDPRKASSEYKKVHNHLVYELDEACWICGVRQSTLPKGEHMETHPGTLSGLWRTALTRTRSSLTSLRLVQRTTRTCANGLTARATCSCCARRITGMACTAFT